MTSSGNESARTVWLVRNAASGSNDEDAVKAVCTALGEAGFVLARDLCFPEEPAPTPAELRAAEVGMLVVFGGDGTVHSVVTAAAGWDGPLLVLPGGTMNILARKLHGEAPAPEIVARLASRPIRRARPAVVRSRHGMGLSGVLAGPGAIWNEVREAMRTANVLELVSAAREAITYSATGPKVICEQVDCGREEGYAAITVTPHEDGLEAKGYYAETLGDFAGQGIALLNRDFRNGPHDELGRHPRLRLVCPQEEQMGLLIDGEPFDGAAHETFELAPCPVDLVTTLEEAEAGPGEAGKPDAR